jgi:F1F0 ATPase subunit 2
MNEMLILLGAGVAGLILGTIFFGGLWWTIRKGVLSAQPALWFLGSLLVRMSVVLVGFYFVGHGYWDRLAACLLGFMIARLIVTHRTQAPLENRFSPRPEGSHAP